MVVCYEKREAEVESVLIRTEEIFHQKMAEAQNLQVGTSNELRLEIRELTRENQSLKMQRDEAERAMKELRATYERTADEVRALGEVQYEKKLARKEHEMQGWVLQTKEKLQKKITELNMRLEQTQREERKFEIELMGKDIVVKNLVAHVRSIIKVYRTELKWLTVQVKDFATGDNLAYFVFDCFKNGWLVYMGVLFRNIKYGKNLHNSEIYQSIMLF